MKKFHKKLIAVTITLHFFFLQSSYPELSVFFRRITLATVAQNLEKLPYTHSLVRGKGEEYVCNYMKERRSSDIDHILLDFCIKKLRAIHKDLDVQLVKEMESIKSFSQKEFPIFLLKEFKLCLPVQGAKHKKTVMTFPMFQKVIMMYEDCVSCYLFLGQYAAKKIHLGYHVDFFVYMLDRLFQEAKGDYFGEKWKPDDAVDSEKKQKLIEDCLQFLDRYYQEYEGQYFYNPLLGISENIRKRQKVFLQKQEEKKLIVDKYENHLIELEKINQSFNQQRINVYNHTIFQMNKYFCDCVLLYRKDEYDKEESWHKFLLSHFSRLKIQQRKKNWVAKELLMHEKEKRALQEQKAISHYTLIDLKAMQETNQNYLCYVEHKKSLQKEFEKKGMDSNDDFETIKKEESTKCLAHKNLCGYLIYIDCLNNGISYQHNPHFARKGHLIYGKSLDGNMFYRRNPYWL